MMAQSCTRWWWQWTRERGEALTFGMHMQPPNGNFAGTARGTERSGARNIKR
jgi:hypothetical protein